MRYCARCGGRIEPLREGKTQCGYCSYLERERKKQKKYQGEYIDNRWIAYCLGYYPEEDVEEVLVTNWSGDVYVLSKYGGTWDEVMEKDYLLAWMYLPTPYKITEKT